MPYVNEDLRHELEVELEELVSRIDITAFKHGVSYRGLLNYTMCVLAARLLMRSHSSPSYDQLNDALGVFEAAKLEFHRRLMVRYEGNKIAENGDLPEFEQFFLLRVDEPDNQRD